MICMYCDRQFPPLDLKSHILCSAPECVAQAAKDYEIPEDEVKEMVANFGSDGKV